MRSLCVSVVNIHMILYFLCKVVRFFVCVIFFCFLFYICCSFFCLTHRSHAIYAAVSRYGVISSFETPLNLTISFVTIFSRGFKQRISSELDGYFSLSNEYANCGNNDALFQISLAHNFGACTNVSCNCLFGVYRPTREFFTQSYGDVTIIGEGLQILTYARHSIDHCH